jgi:hypothetical protein
MKTQIDIRKSKKWAILFIVLMALSASMNAQPEVKSGDGDNSDQAIAEESSNNKDSTGPVLLVESSQDRKDELKSNSRHSKDVMQVGYYQKSKTTAWYKIRQIVTKKPALNCNVCTRVVSTPYVVYMKPRVK